MPVFAFDRDRTVNINPHPRHDAVPLEWVRHLAHNTPYAVYAIEIQTLAEEAAIPGVVDIIGRHQTTGTSGSARNSPMVGTSSSHSGASGYHSSLTYTRARTATSLSTTSI